MFRRSQQSRRFEMSTQQAPPRRDLVAELGSAGWLLPKGLRDDTPRWSLVGTVASPLATAVDPAGLVAGEGWSLDWWVGADDRWRLPVREPAVRQRLLEEAPVVETTLRVPGGEAIQRVYGIRTPRPVGDEWVVVEIENATSIPFASVLVVRPFVANGVGSVGEITIEPVEGGRGRDVAHLVRVDGRPGLVLPRCPARFAVGNEAMGDLVDRVTSGAASSELMSASCPSGLATLAMVFPTPHTAVLRALIPVGDVDPVSPLAFPQVVPDADRVASGWEVHRRGPRIEVPDVHVSGAFERARAHIQLAHSGDAVRRDGHRSSDLELGATDVLLAAFDMVDRPAEVGTVVARWVDRLASFDVDGDVVLLAAVSRHWLIHRIDELLEWMLPGVAAAVERIARAQRKGQITDPTRAWRVAESLLSTGRMLAQVGQGEASAAVAELEQKLRATAVAPSAAVTAVNGEVGSVSAVDRLMVARGVELEELVAEGGPLSTWPGPNGPGRRIGHDLAASAGLLIAVRRRLLAETADGLALLPEHPEAWYGGGVEVHDLPTEWGRISYGVRWHGIRPALLWDLEPHPGIGVVRLTSPALDPGWSTVELRGDALLGEVVPPRGLQSLKIVAEHPDIDPSMRRPGTDSQPPSAPSLEGGTFS